MFLQMMGSDTGIEFGVNQEEKFNSL